MQPVSSAKFRHFPITSCSREKRYQALHGFSVLQATESWAGPGNEARLSPQKVGGWGGGGVGEELSTSSVGSSFNV